LAAKHLHAELEPNPAGILGCGLIAFEILRFLLAALPDITTVYCYDLDQQRARKFGERAMKAFEGLRVETVKDVPSLFDSTSLVAMATTAISPHVNALPGGTRPRTILHISLRDLAPEVILDSDNIVDDIDHVCRAETSVHLAEKKAGNRGFIRCTLADIT